MAPDNTEILEILKREHMVKYIKSQRFRRLGHVHRIEDARINVANKLLNSKTRKESPRPKCLDKVLCDLKIMGDTGCDAAKALHGF